MSPDVSCAGDTLQAVATRVVRCTRWGRGTVIGYSRWDAWVLYRWDARAETDLWFWVTGTITRRGAQRALAEFVRVTSDGAETVTRHLPPASLSTFSEASDG